MAAANCENRADEVDMLLASIGPGEVRTLFVESTGAAMDRLRAHARATGRPTVVHCWRRLPDVHKVVDETVAAVARAALDAWPDWYVGAAVHFVSGNGTEAAAINGAARRAVLASLRGVNAAWLRAAATRCAERRVPLLTDFAAAVQARQLSVALSSGGPIVAMVLDAQPKTGETSPPPPRASRLRAFANAAAWFAKEAGARLVAVLPESLVRSTPSTPSRTGRATSNPVPTRRIRRTRIARRRQSGRSSVARIRGAPGNAFSPNGWRPTRSSAACFTSTGVSTRSAPRRISWTSCGSMVE